MLHYFRQPWKQSYPFSLGGVNTVRRSQFFFFPCEHRLQKFWESRCSRAARPETKERKRAIRHDPSGMSWFSDTNFSHAHDTTRNFAKCITWRRRQSVTCVGNSIKTDWIRLNHEYNLARSILLHIVSNGLIYTTRLIDVLITVCDIVEFREGIKEKRKEMLKE